VYPTAIIFAVPGSTKDKYMHKLREKFKNKKIQLITKHAPEQKVPYPTVDKYDSRVWDAAFLWGKKGDYVWNIAGVPIEYVKERKGTDISETAHEADRNAPRDFPYRKNYMPPFIEMFDSLRFIADNIPDKWFTPLIEEGKLYIGSVERKYPEDYNNVDGLTDIYVEKARIACRESGKLSPSAAWVFIKQKAKELRLSLPKDIIERRELVYSLSRGCNLYNTALAVYSLKRFAREKSKVLDPTAGWGDRLIACAATNMEEYISWDPNKDLCIPYRKMMSDMKKAGSKLKYKLISKPFEQAYYRFEESGDLVGYFDVVLWNPPFFDKELYQGDETSSIVFNTRDDWWNIWHQESLKHAIAGLKKGGVFLSYCDPPIMSELKRILPDLGLIFFGTIGFRQKTEKKFSVMRTLEVWKRHNL